MAHRSGKSRRDNFTQSAIAILYKRSGGKCCRCGATTFGPVTNNLTKFRNIGQAAHIAAAAPGGPRYDPNMSADERTSATNGLWLCSNCHDVIDRDVEEFTIQRLREIKRVGEERARKEVGVATVNPSQQDKGNILDAGISAATIVEIRKHKADLLQLHGQEVELEEAEDFLEAVEFVNFEVDSYLPEVGAELTIFLSKLVAYSSNNSSVALEVIRRLKQVADAFHSSWDKDDVEIISNTVHTMTEGRSRNTKVYQSAVAFLKDLSTYKELRRKRFHIVPRDLLNSLKRTDEPDIGPPPTKKAANEMAPDTEEKYLDLMQQLACTEDEDMTLQLESQLVDMGYEPNVQ